MSEGRVFLRGMSSERYGLKELRQAQLAAPRVRGDEVVVDDAKVGHSGDSKDSRTWWRIGPGDDPFLTQTIQVHFVEIPAGKSNHGHGHQNEAVVLHPRGLRLRDPRRQELPVVEGRPRRRAHRLGAPPLQRRQQRRRRRS